MRKDVRIAAVAAAAALLVTGLPLPQASLWGDEGVSLGLAQTTWPVFWQVVLGHEEFMGLYYVLLRGWLGLLLAIGAPPADLAIRLPSIAFAAVSVAIVYLIGARMFGRAVGGLAVVLYLANFVVLSIAGEARSYGLELGLSALSWYAFFGALTSVRRQALWWTVYAGLATAAVYAHPFSGFVVAAQCVTYAVFLMLHGAWRDRSRHGLPGMAAATAATAVLVAPLLWVAIANKTTGGHVVQVADAIEVARTVWNLAGHNLLFAAFFVVAVLVALVRGLRQHGERSGAVLALLCWAAVPSVLSFGLTQPLLNLHLFFYRYLVVIVPPLCLLAAYGALLVRPLWLRAGLGALLVLTALTAVPLTYATANKQAFRPAAAWIDSRYEPHDGLICASWSCGLSLDHYLSLDGVASELRTDELGAFSWDTGRISTFGVADVARQGNDHPRLVFVDTPLGGDPPEDGQQAQSARAYLDQHYVLLDSAEFPGSYGSVTVRLYRTR